MVTDAGAGDDDRLAKEAVGHTGRVGFPFLFLHRSVGIWGDDVTGISGAAPASVGDQ